MSNEWTLPDKQDSTPFQEMATTKRARRPRRAWWNFHVIPLALGLFPLVYLRHLFNAGHGLIFGCVATVFVVWWMVGICGKLTHPQKREVRTWRRVRINWLAMLLATLLITGYFAAGWLLAGYNRIFSNAFVPFRFLPTTSPFEFIVLALGFSLLLARRLQSQQASGYATLGLGGLLLKCVLEMSISSLFMSRWVRGLSSFDIDVLRWGTVIAMQLLGFISWTLIVATLLVQRPGKEDAR